MKFINEIVQKIKEDMTVISEFQAYNMGLVYNNREMRGHSNDISIPNVNTCEMYRYVPLDSLHGQRKIDFLRGVFDRRAYIKSNSHISIQSIYLPQQMISDLTIPNVIEELQYEMITWYGVNALELMALLYTGDDNMQHFSKSNYDLFLSWANPTIRKPINFKWTRINDLVEPPTKNKFSDSGYDLSIIFLLREIDGVHYFDTGISVEPPNGYYFELVGRSSIVKTGWMLANNIGIIDASYRGTIIVPLIKVNPEANELVLPKKLVQIIPRQLILMRGVEVQTIDNTSRGDGGFGSSG